MINANDLADAFAPNVSVIKMQRFGARGVRNKCSSEPLTAAGDGVLRLDELLVWLDRTQERIAAALSRMDDPRWAREVTTDNNRKMTVGRRVFFPYFHET